MKTIIPFLIVMMTGVSSAHAWWFECEKKAFKAARKVSEVANEWNWTRKDFENYEALIYTMGLGDTPKDPTIRETFKIWVLTDDCRVTKVEVLP